MPTLSDAIQALVDYKEDNPSCTKDEIQAIAITRLGLLKERSVYVDANREYAFRFSQASGNSFSNTILGLAKLGEYDSKPFIVCVNRQGNLQFLMANSSFLKKISHSSHQLKIDNVKGSFLGHDIAREFGNFENAPKNFEALFALHQKIGWDDNLRRLVSATGEIEGTGKKFDVVGDIKNKILKASELCEKAVGLQEFLEIQDRLRGIVDDKHSAIMKAAAIDNVNLRGNAIEQIITEGANFHSIDDISYPLQCGIDLVIDIKTKILEKSSSPKAYNVDKILECFSDGKSVFCLFLVGISVIDDTIDCRLVCALEPDLLDITTVQFHWSGRNSRGATQFAGDLSKFFGQNYSNTIDREKANQFLEKLINL